MFGRRIGKTWPRIYHQLKGYNYGYKPKQAKPFTKDQVQRALQLPPAEKMLPHEWVLKKAVISLNFNGGVRGIELRSLTYGSLEETDEGVWVNYIQAKQQAVKENRFLVPFNKERPDLCFAAPVIEYLKLLRESHPNLHAEDPLFYRALKSGRYSVQVMGQHTLADIGKEVASRLGLDTPKQYTGHGWRRTSATEAANQVRNSTSYNYRVPHLPLDLSWVDLELGCSSILLGQ